MFDKYLIGEDTVRNIGLPEQPSGFAFEARLGYYRGLGLSMLEELGVTVAGTVVARDFVRFHAGSKALSLDEMETAYELRWHFGEWATISVLTPGGLTPGPHILGLTERLRISYLPFPSIVSDEKTVCLK